MFSDNSKSNVKVTGVLVKNIATRNEHLIRNLGKYSQYNIPLTPAIGEVIDIDYNKELYDIKDGRSLLEYTHEGNKVYDTMITDMYFSGNRDKEVIGFDTPTIDKVQRWAGQYSDYITYLDEILGDDIHSRHIQFINGLLSSQYIENALRQTEVGVVRDINVAVAKQGIITTNLNNMSGKDTRMGTISNQMYSNLLYNGAIFNSDRHSENKYITPSLINQYGNNLANVMELGDMLRIGTNEYEIKEDLGADIKIIHNFTDSSNDINLSYLTTNFKYGDSYLAENNVGYIGRYKAENEQSYYVSIVRTDDKHFIIGDYSNITKDSNGSPIDKFQKNYVPSSKKTLSIYDEHDNAVTSHTPTEGLDGEDSENVWDSFKDVNTDNQKSILSKTAKLFDEHKIDTMVSRFHFSNDSGNDNEMIDTAKSKQYGNSHGRNLLTKKAQDEHTPDITNGYSNPYCRTWTHHHQYNQVKKLIRPFMTTSDEGEDVPMTITNVQSINSKYRSANIVYDVNGNVKSRDVYGDEYLGENTVLNRNGFVNIAPSSTSEDDKKNVSVDKCMFSIENLAWKDVTEIQKEKYISKKQVGPNGGRIMWFPPYDLSFNENVNVEWEQSSFIGRGERIYTYKNTDRTGNLSFTLLIDHPSIVNTFAKLNDGDLSSDIDSDILRFFAGCGIPDISDDTEPGGGEEPGPNPEPKEGSNEIAFWTYFPNNYSGSMCEANEGTNDKPRSVKGEINVENSDWWRYLLFGNNCSLFENDSALWNGYESSEKPITTDLNNISDDTSDTIKDEWIGVCKDYVLNSQNIDNIGRECSADYSKVNKTNDGNFVYKYRVDHDLRQLLRKIDEDQNGTSPSYSDTKSFQMNTKFNDSYHTNGANYTFGEIVCALLMLEGEKYTYEDYSKYYNDMIDLQYEVRKKYHKHGDGNFDNEKYNKLYDSEIKKIKGEISKDDYNDIEYTDKKGKKQKLDLLDDGIIDVQDNRDRYLMPTIVYKVDLIKMGFDNDTIDDIEYNVQSMKNRFENISGDLSNMINSHSKGNEDGECTDKDHCECESDECKEEQYEVMKGYFDNNIPSKLTQGENAVFILYEDGTFEYKDSGEKVSKKSIDTKVNWLINNCGVRKEKIEELKSIFDALINDDEYEITGFEIKGGATARDFKNSDLLAERRANSVASLLYDKIGDKLSSFENRKVDGEHIEYEKGQDGTLESDEVNKKQRSVLTRISYKYPIKNVSDSGKQKKETTSEEDEKLKDTYEKWYNKLTTGSDGEDVETNNEGNISTQSEEVVSEGSSLVTEYQKIFETEDFESKYKTWKGYELKDLTEELNIETDKDKYNTNDEWNKKAVKPLLDVYGYDFFVPACCIAYDGQNTKFIEELSKKPPIANEKQAEETIKTNKGNIKNLEKENKDINKKIEKLTKESEKYDKEIKELEDKIKSNNEKIGGEDGKGGLNKEIKDLEDKIAEIDYELSHWTTDKKDKRELNSEKDKYNYELNNKKREKTKLENKNQEYTDEINSLTEKKKKVDDEITSLEDSKNKNEAQINGYKEEDKQLEETKGVELDFINFEVFYEKLRVDLSDYKYDDYVPSDVKITYNINDLPFKMYGGESIEKYIDNSDPKTYDLSYIELLKDYLVVSYLYEININEGFEYACEWLKDNLDKYDLLKYELYVKYHMDYYLKHYKDEYYDYHTDWDIVLHEDCEVEYDAFELAINDVLYTEIVIGQYKKTKNVKKQNEYIDNINKIFDKYHIKEVKWDVDDDKVLKEIEEKSEKVRLSVAKSLSKYCSKISTEMLEEEDTDLSYDNESAQEIYNTEILSVVNDRYESEKKRWQKIKEDELKQTIDKKNKEDEETRKKQALEKKRRENEYLYKIFAGNDNVSRYEDESEYFKKLEANDPLVFKSIKDKYNYFDPAFHSMSPEGFNARLTFLHQCTRQGHTIESTSDNGITVANNLAFGRMPVCVLRIGDFINTKIIINSMSIQYDNGGIQWDLNPEGAGVQPMYAKINLGIVILGGQSLEGPISRLQNAVTFNYYANTGVYDDRADMVSRNSNGELVYDKIFVTRSDDSNNKLNGYVDDGNGSDKMKDK